MFKDEVHSIAKPTDQAIGWGERTPPLIHPPPSDRSIGRGQVEGGRLCPPPQSDRETEKTVLEGKGGSSDSIETYIRKKMKLWAEYLNSPLWMTAPRRVLSLWPRNTGCVLFSFPPPPPVHRASTTFMFGAHVPPNTTPTIPMQCKLPMISFKLTVMCSFRSASLLGLIILVCWTYSIPIQNFATLFFISKIQ